jgi:hypothetical protein
MKISPLLALLAPAMATPLLETRQAPPPDKITIVNAQTSGNGCPQGTVSTSFSPDKTLVTFGFDAFQTYIGPGTKPQDKSKNCQIHLTLKCTYKPPFLLPDYHSAIPSTKLDKDTKPTPTDPGGFQYSLMQATYHGYARLDAGVTGNFYSTYFFSQDASNSASSRTTITGSQYLAGQVYQKTDIVENASTVWSPCGDTGILNVNNRIALTATSSSLSGELSDDDATIAFYQKVLVQWRTCTR